MYENKELTVKTPLANFREFLAGALTFGVILASTHGGLLPGHSRDLSASDFTAKIASELHTHNDLHLQSDHILVDPKNLRSVRSEGDKTAERDGLSGNWDVYQS